MPANRQPRRPWPCFPCRRATTAALRLAALSVALATPPSAFAATDHVTFSRDVAPIFFHRCATCHRPGEVAPMSLLDYAAARPWARSIARAVRARAMPPWSAESDHRRWANDMALSPDEIATIVRWVESGAPEGDPADLPPKPTFPSDWSLGEPDLVLTLDGVEVPAGGPDLFPQQWLEIDLDRPRWVRAIEFLPGDRRVTHHFQSAYNTPATVRAPTLGQDVEIPEGRGGSGVFAIWTAGMPPYAFPEGMGRIVTPETRILVDSHYHPFGEATTDQTRIGLYFGEGELRKEVATMVAVNTGLRIPPGVADHPELAFHVFDRDMQILAFSPHMHVRGKAMRYELTYPDGRRETLLDVPRYDYNWQWLYYPVEPIDVPAGSRLDVTAVWDNSAGNPANPDPGQEIIYRGDTFNEMFVGFFEAIQKDGVYHQPKPPTQKLEELLAAHPAEDSYLIGGFAPIGLYAPKTGEGWLYLVQGLAMMTISLDDFEWNGNRLTVDTQFPTPEASATTTHLEVELTPEGRLQGKLRIGTDTERPLELPVAGKRMSAANAPGTARDSAR